MEIYKNFCDNIFCRLILIFLINNEKYILVRINLKRQYVSLS